MVEKNIGKKLTGEVADDDTLAGRLMKEAFARWETAPITALAADSNALHGVVENDLVPEVFQSTVKNGVMGFGAIRKRIW